MMKRKAEAVISKSTKKKKTAEDSKKETVSKKADKTGKSQNQKQSDVEGRGKVDKSYPKLIDADTNFETGEKIEYSAPVPTRNSHGEIIFKDFPEFKPNLTPKEVLQAGSFGGTYFRPIKSGVTKKSYSGAWKELPKDWIEGLSIGKQVSSSTYDEKVNTYNAKCGGSLEMWESSGWIHKQDPYGWFQWYCRFYQGRRSADDERQIGRWLRCAGKTGRWRNNLISKCVKSKCAFDNQAISPVVRQTLQHWGYKLNKVDFEAYAKKMKSKGMA